MADEVSIEDRLGRLTWMNYNSSFEMEDIASDMASDHWNSKADQYSNWSKMAPSFRECQAKLTLKVDISFKACAANKARSQQMMITSFVLILFKGKHFTVQLNFTLLQGTQWNGSEWGYINAPIVWNTLSFIFIIFGKIAV